MNKVISKVTHVIFRKCPPTPSAEINSLQPQIDMVYPDDFTPELVSLLTGLLQYSPEKRLGYNGASEVKIHAWFQSVDWTLANKLGLEPPFAPSKGEVHALDAADIGWCILFFKNIFFVTSSSLLT